MGNFDYYLWTNLDMKMPGFRFKKRCLFVCMISYSMVWAFIFMSIHRVHMNLI